MKITFSLLLLNLMIYAPLFSQSRETVKYSYFMINMDGNDTIFPTGNNIVYSKDSIFFENFFYLQDTFIVQDKNIYLLKNEHRYLFFGPNNYSGKTKSYDIDAKHNTLLNMYNYTLHEFIPKGKGVLAGKNIPYIIFDVNEYTKIADSSNLDLTDINIKDYSFQTNYTVFYNPYLGIIEASPILAVYKMILMDIPKETGKDNAWFPK